MDRVYAYDGIVPVIDPTAFVHPEAVVIGDVIVGAGCYVGPGTVLRGDFGRITLGEGANLQETCVVHSFPNLEAVIEDEGHIGHGVVLHGCRIGRNAMIGMNAVVMDEAVTGENAIVAALAFVKGCANIPAGSLAVGSPARVVRSLSPQEIAWKRQGTGVYRRLAGEARDKLVAAEPLAAPEPGRRRVAPPEYDPLFLQGRNSAMAKAATVAVAASDRLSPEARRGHLRRLRRLQRTARTPSRIRVVAMSAYSSRVIGPAGRNHM